MRISDWSSDVCSSDLFPTLAGHHIQCLRRSYRDSVGTETLSANSTHCSCIFYNQCYLPQDVGRRAKRDEYPHIQVSGRDCFPGYRNLRTSVLLPKPQRDRKSVDKGKRVSVRVNHGG